MNTVSILKDLKFSEEKPVVEVLLETDFTKEIRITLVKNQAMKKHQTPFPIVIELVNMGNKMKCTKINNIKNP